MKKYTFIQEYLKKRRAMLVLGHIGEFFFKADIWVESIVVETYQTQSGWDVLLSGIEQKCRQQPQSEGLVGYPITPIATTPIDTMINTSLIQIYQEGETIAFERLVIQPPALNKALGIYTASVHAPTLSDGLQKLTTARLSLLTRESGVRIFYV